MRCPKQNVRSRGAKLHVIIQHPLGLGERWFLYPPCISCPLALGGGDFILSWAECWGEEGEEKQVTAYLPAGPVESFLFSGLGWYFKAPLSLVVFGST